MDITFEIDLGELVKGHHVVARGIDLGGHPVPMMGGDQAFYEYLAATATGPANPGITGSVRGPIPDDVEVVGSRQSEPELHYELVPGVDPDENLRDPFFWYWMLKVSDDVETVYRDDNGGVIAPFVGGVATHGTRDLGGQIPPSASRLVIRFEPAARWNPPGAFRRELVIDLLSRCVVEPS